MSDYPSPQRLQICEKCYDLLATGDWSMVGKPRMWPPAFVILEVLFGGLLCICRHRTPRSSERPLGVRGTVVKSEA